MIAPKVIKIFGFPNFENPNILNRLNGEGYREEHVDKHGVTFRLVSGSETDVYGEGETEEMGRGRDFDSVGVVGFVPIAIFLPTGVKEGFCREPFHVEKRSDVGIRVPEGEGVGDFQR